MPYKELTAMDIRKEMIKEYLSKDGYKRSKSPIISFVGTYNLIHELVKYIGDLLNIHFYTRHSPENKEKGLDKLININ